MCSFVSELLRNEKSMNGLWEASFQQEHNWRFKVNSCQLAQAIDGRNTILIHGKCKLLASFTALLILLEVSWFSVFQYHKKKLYRSQKQSVQREGKL